MNQFWRAFDLWERWEKNDVAQSETVMRIFIFFGEAIEGVFIPNNMTNWYRATLNQFADGIFADLKMA